MSESFRTSKVLKKAHDQMRMNYDQKASYSPCNVLYLTRIYFGECISFLNDRSLKNAGVQIPPKIRT